MFIAVISRPMPSRSLLQTRIMFCTSRSLSVITSSGVMVAIESRRCPSMMPVAMPVSSDQSRVISRIRRMALRSPSPEEATAKLTVATTVSGTMPAAIADSTRTLVVRGRMSIRKKRWMSGNTNTRPPRSHENALPLPATIASSSAPTIFILVTSWMTSVMRTRTMKAMMKTLMPAPPAYPTWRSRPPPESSAS